MRPARVVVINLDRRPDRLAAFDYRWALTAPGSPRVTRIAATDNPDDPAAGCWQSHLDALRSGPGPLLVFEDDVIFRGFTLDLPEPPPGWRLLRLGGLLQQAVMPPRPPWIGVSRISHTHAYVARDPDDLADRLEAAARRDAGAALAFGIAGHYRLIRAVCGQAAGRSDLTGLDRPGDDFWDQKGT